MTPDTITSDTMTTGTMTIDPVALSAQLIRLESITPDTGKTLDLLQDILETLGFHCHRMVFHEEGTEPVPNLYARIGKTSPNICFAGHTDVVPTGALADWSVDPFEGVIRDGRLWGRGAADMKAAIAAFVCACERLIKKGTLTGSLSLLITGDEEGPSINGTRKVLDWLQAQGEKLDYCIVGEPTNPEKLGDMIKIGRRGSLHGHLIVEGVQGHVAYPHKAHNPIPDLIRLLDVLTATPLDQGNDHFQPSNLEIIDLHVGNMVQNIIPARAEARFNIRFNSDHTSHSLKTMLTGRLERADIAYRVNWSVSGDSFLTPPGELSQALVESVEKHLNITPALSTTGGTSDARFIKDFCPVVEFGLVGETMHKVDENVAVSDIRRLADIYETAVQNLAFKTKKA